MNYDNWKLDSPQYNEIVSSCCGSQYVLSIDFENDIKLSEFDKILDQIELLLFKEYEINHVNIQPEFRKSDEKDIIVQD